ncbi:MAG TPA: PilN domain-containing protein [Terriglobales bacterium]|nr:PilN domain-containing protein [Terriglobales bacterium]
MRLNINLASQPYEDAREVYLRWGTAVVIVGLLAAVLCYATFSAWHRYHSINGDIAREKTTLQKLNQQQAEDLAILNEPKNSDVRQQAAFLNDLIERKAVSWTHIFNILEKMMPPQMHVVALRPKLDNGDILLELDVAGQSRERALELVRRMEQSPSFRDAQILAESTENVNANTGPDVLKFVISAQYVPQNSESGPALEADARGVK